MEPVTIDAARPDDVSRLLVGSLGILGIICEVSLKVLPTSVSRETLTFDWSETQARGHGAIWLNNGVPDDAHGAFAPHSVTIRAFRPRSRIFTRMALRYRVDGRLFNGTLPATYYPSSGYGLGYWAW